MNSEGDVSPEILGVDPLDWAAIKAAKPNVLICGEPLFIDSFLGMLVGRCEAPMRRITHRRVLGAVSAVVDGTVVLEDAEGYSTSEQQALLDWLTYTGGGVQLITTTRTPLFDLVEQGSFLDALFYRLNIVSLDLSCPAEGALPIWNSLERRIN